MIYIYVKGDAHTPRRFWTVGLATNSDHVRFFHENGYFNSKELTKEFENLSIEEQLKCDFILDEHKPYLKRRAYNGWLYPQTEVEE